MRYEIFDARMRTPFSCFISGQSFCGKTSFVLDLLRNESRLIDRKFDNIIIFTGSKNTGYEKIKDKRIKIIYGVPQEEHKRINTDKHSLWILDDLMEELTGSKELISLFSRDCHHLKISVVYITQNVFHCKRSNNMTVLTNTQYLVLFKNQLDNRCITTISRRIDPYRHKRLVRLIQHVQEKYNYIFIDGKINTRKEAKYRSDIFNPIFQRAFILKEEYEKKE